MKTYKVLSALLDYPSAALVRAVPQLRAALHAEALLSSQARSALEPLLRALESEDLLDLQEHYVDLFDRVRSASLHLFEHVHGESRDRGQALVDLKALYARHGLAFCAGELPDYLPAFLEFLGRLEPSEARTLLAETSAILDAIGVRLARRGSLYAPVFDALLALAGASRGTAQVSEDDIRKEDDPASLDAAWEEQPAFGPAPACGATVRARDAVVRFHAPARQPRAGGRAETTGA